MDVEYFNEVVFDKLKENKQGIILELSNGNQRSFHADDVESCSIDDKTNFCIGDWCFDITHIIGISYVNPLAELFDGLKNDLSEYYGL